MIDTLDLLSRLESHAMRLGVFRRVNRHEPKRAPDAPVLALWLRRIRPAVGGSGLAATSVVVVFTARCYLPMLVEPQGTIDPRIMACTDKFMASLTGDVALGDTVREVDLYGRFGEGLTAESGYTTIDNKMMRIVDITVPLVINDVWEQG